MWISNSEVRVGDLINNGCGATSYHLITYVHHLIEKHSTGDIVRSVEYGCRGGPVWKSLRPMDNVYRLDQKSEFNMSNQELAKKIEKKVWTSEPGDAFYASMRNALCLRVIEVTHETGSGEEDFVTDCAASLVNWLQNEG